jgi:hypothetical protein
LSWFKSSSSKPPPRPKPKSSSVPPTSSSTPPSQPGQETKVVKTEEVKIETKSAPNVEAKTIRGSRGLTEREVQDVVEYLNATKAPFLKEFNWRWSPYQVIGYELGLEDIRGYYTVSHPGNAVYIRRGHSPNEPNRGELSKFMLEEFPRKTSRNGDTGTLYISDILTLGDLHQKAVEWKARKKHSTGMVAEEETKEELKDAILKLIGNLSIQATERKLEASDFFNTASILAKQNEGSGGITSEEVNELQEFYKKLVQAGGKSEVIQEFEKILEKLNLSLSDLPSGPSL